MIIYPAIDLRNGKVVRLKEGDPNQQTTFSDDPAATARQWIEQGAAWIHVVNLDGAFNAADQAAANKAALAQIAALGVNVQFGGGLRTLTDIESALDAGARRVVLGTVAVKSPEIVQQAIERFGAETVCVALDARDGKVTTHGWTENADVSPVTLGSALAAQGLKHALFTDVSRDGMLSGVNIEATVALGQQSGLAVIASGGVSTAAEITQLAASGFVAGAIIGMALYEGRLSLSSALTAAKGGIS